MAKKKQASDKINIDQLAKLFGLPPSDDIQELNSDYVWEAGEAAYREALKDDRSESAAEAAREKAEFAAQDDLYANWYDAVESAASDLFEKHHLELHPAGKWWPSTYHETKAEARPYDLKIVPSISWLDAAEKIRQTADGVGYAYVGNDVKEFLSLGPWTARQAVLEHLGVITQYPEVYGSASARRLYESAFR